MLDVGFDFGSIEIDGVIFAQVMCLFFLSYYLLISLFSYVDPSVGSTDIILVAIST